MFGSCRHSRDASLDAEAFARVAAAYEKRADLYEKHIEVSFATTLPDT